MAENKDLVLTIQWDNELEKYSAIARLPNGDETELAYADNWYAVLGKVRSKLVELKKAHDGGAFGISDARKSAKRLQAIRKEKQQAFWSDLDLQELNEVSVRVSNVVRNMHRDDEGWLETIDRILSAELGRVPNFGALSWAELSEAREKIRQRKEAAQV